VAILHADYHMSELLWFDPNVNGDGAVDLPDMMELIER